MFVYDTLTFRPSALPMVEVQDILDSLGVLSISPQSEALLHHYSEDGSVIPYVGKDIIRNWLKRGREAYTRAYDGRRPTWKYLIYMEYGPMYSRPHFHVLFWNISKVDYKRFFGKPWYRLYGSTKPSYFNGDSTQKDRECITRYISKYCSKGVFESPWVKDGLLPKPHHFYSQGLGLGYLSSSKFDFFRSVLADVFKAMVTDQRDELKGTLLEKMHVRDLIQRLDITEGFNIPQEALEALSVYRDDKGFPHRLPRYYKQKLLNLLRPNVFSFSVQSHLLVRADHETDKRLQKLAFERGHFKASLSRPYLGLGKRLYDSLCRALVVAQKLSACTALERRKTRLINHYKRPMMGAQGNRYHVTDKFLALVC